MNRYISIAAVAIASPLLFCSSAPAEDRSAAPAPGPTVLWATPLPNNAESDAQLRQELDKARAQIDQLQNQLNQLRQTVDRLQSSRLSEQYRIYLTPQTPTDNSRQGWIPRQFDGIQYYIVPTGLKGTTTRPSIH